MVSPQSFSLALVKYGIKEVIKSMMAKMIVTAAMGRLKKIEKLPFERVRDCRRFDSNIGPRTKARMSGAGSYSNFLKRYPTIPKINMTRTSKILFLRL